jgi:hypothetical protein
MSRARWRGREYELLNFTEDAEWVLRDESGDVLVFEDPGPHEQVAVQCELCGRWSANVAPRGARWVCHDAACYHTAY